jgi:hypothetical protein
MKKIGFAVLLVVIFIPALIHTAYAQTSQEKSYIGVITRDITEDLVKSFNLKTNKGVVVARVVEGSPADKAGIKKGDVITIFDGREIQNKHELALIIAATPIDKEVPVRLFMGEREATLTVKVGRVAQVTSLTRAEASPERIPQSVLLQGALNDAIQMGQTDNVRAMIDKGAKVNWRDSNGFTSLIIAARYTNNVDVVKFLIEKGADVNADDKNGQTAVMQAASYGHADVVRVLAEKGADLNMKDSIVGFTALMHAFSDRPHANAVRVLIEKGADINARDKNGQTVLGKALFMMAGGKDYNGYTPQQEKEIAEIVHILQKAGAREK